MGSWYNYKRWVLKDSPFSVDVNGLFYYAHRYYEPLKEEIGYKNAIFNEIQADSISKDGRILSTKGIPSIEKIVKIYFTSVIIKWENTISRFEITTLKLPKSSWKRGKNLRKWSNMWSKAKNGLVQPSK